MVVRKVVISILKVVLWALLQPASMPGTVRGRTIAAIVTVVLLVAVLSLPAMGMIHVGCCSSYQYGRAEAFLLGIGILIVVATVVFSMRGEVERCVGRSGLAITMTGFASGLVVSWAAFMLLRS